MHRDEDLINSWSLDRLKTQDKDLSTLGMSMAMINYCMAVLESYFYHITEWHDHAKIEHGRARHRA